MKYQTINGWTKEGMVAHIMSCRRAYGFAPNVEGMGTLQRCHDWAGREEPVLLNWIEENIA